MRILLADDDLTSRLIAQTALRNLGHECQTVDDGTHAWEAFQTDQPDVVISDWAMPGLTGLQLCRNIRAHQTANYTYFIMVTNHGGQEDILEGMTAGADDYLIKPLDPGDLQARLVAAGRVTSLHHQLTHQRTELVSLNQTLEATNDELRDLDRLKNEFVALVSHELRTPLTSIIGYVSALQRGRAGVMPAEQAELLEVVERNARRLVRLVGDLLLAAKADEGMLQLDLDPKSLDLGAVVDQAIESARPRAEEQHVSVELSVDNGARVVADQARLVQVFDNLITNAIKFSPAESTVSVHISNAGPNALIEIQDKGIGIPLAEQEQLFRRFFRASTATSREIQGSGLGLSIAKAIVDLHNGTIEITSGEAVGTTVVVTLPLAPAEEAASWNS